MIFVELVAKRSFISRKGKEIPHGARLSVPLSEATAYIKQGVADTVNRKPKKEGLR